MKYIRIKNNGEIEPAALHLVGASTKQNDSSKIGQFGSGNKYALAYFLRNGYNVSVFAGERLIPVEVKHETFREQEFGIIYIDGQRTSITTTMGKDWQFWQAMREVYCNALDEGGCSLDFVQSKEPKAGETHFYIDTKKDVGEFMLNFDNYFSTNKKVLFECHLGRILVKSGNEANIYRKGIKCFNTKKTSVFDYDFNHVTIDENRLAMFYWQIEEKIWELIYQCDNEDIIMQVLHTSCNADYMEGNISDYTTISASNISETFMRCIKQAQLAPKGFAGLLKPDEQHTHIVIPTKVYTSIRGLLKDDNVGDKFKVNSYGFYREIEATPLHEATLKKASDFFQETGFEIPYPVHVALFEKKETYGTIDKAEKKIYVSDLCIEEGVNRVVNTIIEEYIHLKHDVADETRDFQNAAIGELVSYMKKANAFVL